mmetsp:Transcript_5098/g.22784  ORF Transcript_5098/g.22784 Transcript_5098/m.22784 type:complete len:215 (+) Transcript_5098:282-926(+)
MLSIRPNFPHSSLMSSMISPYSTSSLSSSTSSISVSETTLEAGRSLGGGGTETAGAPDTPARCAATSSAPGSAACPEALAAVGLGAPAPPCIARCTVSDFSPIFIPCRPWHATSVTEWSWYTKNPYPLLLPVSLSTTSWNCFVGPNASTSSLTIASVRKYGRPPMKSLCARSSSDSDAFVAPPAAAPAGLRPMASRLRPSLGWDGPRLEAAMTL